jgi:hypothetical protein
MIDWDKRTIKGRSGKIYKIAPEAISTGRWAEYEIQSLELSFGNDFSTHYKKITELIKVLTDGNNILQAINRAVTLAKELLSGISNYAETPVPRIIKFCSLFCTYEGEDITSHTADVVREKHEDWKHIPIQDFFLLASEAIPSFRGIYASIIQESEKAVSK